MNLKGLAHASGATALYHQLRNRCTLTVVLFHRVLPPGPGARLFTVTPEFFDECLAFFEAHYQVVGWPHVAAALAGGAPLPERALL